MLLDRQCDIYNRIIGTHVKRLQSELNTLFHNGKKFTPVQVLFGYQARPTVENNLLINQD